MKPKNLVLRRRFAYVESQLEAESTSSRHSPRLKEERQRRLIQEKIDIQKSLDSIVYPILTLRPVEITAEIFIHCLPDTPAPPSVRIAPLLLARICRQWRDIVYSTSRLWAALRITLFEGRDVTLLARLWFGRAGGAPKSLSLELFLDRCPDSFFGAGADCCPSSSTFTVHWADLSSFHGSCFTPTECLALLSRAPRLTHCKFDNLQEGPLPSTPVSRVVLPNLEHFSLETCYLSARPLLPLLNSITCPALRSLEIGPSFQAFTDTQFLSFSERAPNINVLTVKFYNTSADVLTTILHAVPALTSLHLTADAPATFHFLRVFTDSPTFLPRITNIALSPYTRIAWRNSQVKTFVDAVTSRLEAKSTAQLQDFELVLARPVNLVLDHRIASCVSTLKGRGMRIYVGPQRTVS